MDPAAGGAGVAGAKGRRDGRSARRARGNRYREPAGAPARQVRTCPARGDEAPRAVARADRDRPAPRARGPVRRALHGRRRLSHDLSTGTDVVPAQDPDQFRPRRRDGRISGRGTADMKGGLVSMSAHQRRASFTARRPPNRPALRLRRGDRQRRRPGTSTRGRAHRCRGGRDAHGGAHRRRHLARVQRRDHPARTDLRP